MAQTHKVFNWVKLNGRIRMYTKELHELLLQKQAPHCVINVCDTEVCRLILTKKCHATYL